MSSTFAIGLGDRSVSQVIDLLKTHDVEFLVDVRSQADSDQHALFSPEPLQAAVTAAGLRYMSMGDSLGAEPGDPSVQRDGILPPRCVRRFMMEVTNLIMLLVGGTGRVRNARRSEALPDSNSERWAPGRGQPLCAKTIASSATREDQILSSDPGNSV